LGTRLRSVVADLPKAMAPVAGRPFLAHLLDLLVDAGFASVVLAVGYRSEAIRQHFGERYRSLPLTYSVESQPIGTGGAIRLALRSATAHDVFAVNGDTFVEVDFRSMLEAHRRAEARMTVAVHEVADTARYGSLALEGNQIRGFLEKGRHGPGWINAGVYVVPRSLFEHARLPGAFSFESDFLVPGIDSLKPLAFPTRGLFIDIGVPDDYTRAQSLLATRVPACLPPEAGS
jgi:D-glycero-alpha-D-manno-heptose 1-phosphate guanylyltransferase